MKNPGLKRRWISRLLMVSIGLVLFLAGVRIGEFGGLVLMIVGLVPTIIGAADVSLMTEIRDERAHRLEQRRPGCSHMSASLENRSRVGGHVTGQKATSPLAFRHSADGLSVNKL